MAVAATSIAASELLLVGLLARQQLVDPSGGLSSVLFAAFFLGTAAMGFVGGSILGKFGASKIGLFASLMSFFVVVGFWFLGSHETDFILIFLLAFLAGLENPNINGTMNKLIAPASKPKAFSLYQSYSQTIIVGSPVLGSAIFLWGGVDATFAVAALLYLLSGTPWLMFGIWTKTKVASGSIWRMSIVGFQAVGNLEALRDLTISRILNNLLYVAVLTLTPIAAASVTETAEGYATLQGFAITSIRGASLVAGLVGVGFLASRPEFTPLLAKMATYIGIPSLLLLVFGPDKFFVIAGCVLAGIGQYMFRLSGMTLGPPVTPAEILSEVILAGDTVVRFFSAGYSGFLTLTFGLFGATFGPSLILGPIALAMFAPRFLDKAITCYVAELNASELSDNG